MEFTVDKLNPSILSAQGLQNLPNDFCNPDFVPDSWCLLYAAGGSFEVLWDQKLFLVLENCAFLFSPGYAYTVQAPGKNLQLIDIRFEFYPADLRPTAFEPSDLPSVEALSEKSKKLLRFSDHEILDAPSLCTPSPQTKRLLEGILTEHRKQPLFSKEISDLYLKTVLLDLIRETIAPEDTGISDAATKIMRYVHMHITENLQNDVAARALSYHPNYINRVVKKATGMTFHKYVVDEKLHYAASLLLSTNDSITDIAYSLSFNTSSHFSNLFSEKYKCTPSQYRARHFEKRRQKATF